VTNNAAIVLNHSSTFTLANVISGSGTLTNLTGSPSLTAAAGSSYSGVTAVMGGTLFVKNTSGSATGSGAVLVNNATLAGNGIIGGSVTIQSSGNLAPGNSAIGTLTINNTLNLSGNTTIEINKGVGQDLVVANVVHYGGTLTVSDLGGGLAAGDTFQIFNAGSHTGDFTGIVGSPGANLAYAFNPSTGVLSVVSTGGGSPILNVSQSGNILTFSWTDASFKLQSQTNNLTTGLRSNWSDYPNGGASPVSVTNNPANPSVFFRLSQ
jgi:fibronectin-binding autotransporter adhesin